MSMRARRRRYLRKPAHRPRLTVAMIDRLEAILRPAMVDLVTYGMGVFNSTRYVPLTDVLPVWPATSGTDSAPPVQTDSPA